MVIEKTLYYYDNDIDIKTTYVKYHNIGSARLIATTVISMSCSADILLFPFDSQECEVQLMAEDFDGHVTFQTLSDGVDLRSQRLIRSGRLLRHLLRYLLIDQD
jgi:hypothetical protein